MQLHEDVGHLAAFKSKLEAWRQNAKINLQKCKEDKAFTEQPLCREIEPRTLLYVNKKST